MVPVEMGAVGMSAVGMGVVDLGMPAKCIGRGNIIVFAQISSTITPYRSTEETRDARASRVLVASQYVLSMRDRSSSPATNLRTTLVLGPASCGFLDRRRQFCSDCENEISAAPRSAISGSPGGEEKNNKPRFLSDDAWHTREGTPCHGRNCLDDNSLLPPHCHPRR
jgi:hypothetical protein